MMQDNDYEIKSSQCKKTVQKAHTHVKKMQIMNFKNMFKSVITFLKYGYSIY